MATLNGTESVVRRTNSAVAWLYVIFTATLMLAPLPTLAACKDKNECAVGETCQGGACALVPVGESCQSDASCGQGHACVDGKCAAPRIGTTTVEHVQPKAAAPDVPIVPELNTTIPGLTLGSSDGGGSVFFAQYVSAAYRYAVSIVAVAATVMFVFGAFLYLLGSAMPTINRGRAIMLDAAVGMLLVISANLILRTINPATLNLSALTIESVRNIPLDYMMGNADAPGTLGRAGVSPGNACGRQLSDVKTNDKGEVIKPPPPSSSNTCPTNLNIPKACPTRGKGRYGITGITIGTIQKYLEEQSATGIPAGVIMANMLTETWNSCIIVNLFGDVTVCGKSDYIKYYNFGGIGCPDKKDGTCPHQAFPQPKIDKFCKKDAKLSKEYGGKSYDQWPKKCQNDPALTKCSGVSFNSYSSTCKQGCVETEDVAQMVAATKCTEGCYPQPSYAQFKGPPFPSVQCSKIYKNAQEFLNSHLSFVKKCLPFNDSVYKFAYCIGVSTYAGAPEKGEILAGIIEQNCLCGDNDSYACKRDLELEKKVTARLIEKKNLYKLSTQDEVIRVFEGILLPSISGEPRTEASVGL
ncbi:MAG TPA: hypothetical protein VN397_02515 [Candidatus Methylomirabilis sp.]|nr:hypothetical protein [Candidatus Methylomirabilis sp.]